MDSLIRLRTNQFDGARHSLPPYESLGLQVVLVQALEGSQTGFSRDAPSMSMLASIGWPQKRPAAGSRGRFANLDKEPRALEAPAAIFVCITLSGSRRTPRRHKSSTFVLDMKDANHPYHSTNRHILRLSFPKTLIVYTRKCAWSRCRIAS
jgi:hypothetical protein